MTIQTTKDYEMFQFFNWNREVIDYSKVESIANSMRKKNMLHINPIIVGADNYVYDGQHRLLAAKSIGETVYYVKDETLVFEDVLSLNTNSTTWKLTDYIVAYARRGYPEYIKLVDMLNDYNFPLNHYSNLLLLGQSGRISIKNGRFKCTNNTEEMLNQFNKFRIWWEFRFDKKYIFRQSFLKAFYSFVKITGVNIDYFIGKLENKGHLLCVKRGKEDTMTIFAYIYNYKNRYKINIYEKEEDEIKYDESEEYNGN